MAVFQERAKCLKNRQLTGIEPGSESSLTSPVMATEINVRVVRRRTSR
jgi:hypothetical protein